MLTQEEEDYGDDYYGEDGETEHSRSDDAESQTLNPELIGAS